MRLFSPWLTIKTALGALTQSRATTLLAKCFIDLPALIPAAGSERKFVAHCLLWIYSTRRHARILLAPAESVEWTIFEFLPRSLEQPSSIRQQLLLASTAVSSHAPKHFLDQRICDSHNIVLVLLHLLLPGKRAYELSFHSKFSPSNILSLEFNWTLKNISP